VTTQTKHNAATNKQHSNDFDTRKLDKDEGDYSVKTLPADQAKRIVQLRTAKGWNQKELAQQIQETASVVSQYEQGKAIPNQKVLSKMERALGGKIRGYKPGEED
jgi:putative transcription factor